MCYSIIPLPFLKHETSPNVPNDFTVLEVISCAEDESESITNDEDRKAYITEVSYDSLHSVVMCF